MCHKKLARLDKTLRGVLPVLLGIIIGFVVTSHFRTINYETFKKDIVDQLCSYRNLYQNGLPPGHTAITKDLSRTYQSVVNLTSQPKSQRKLLLVGVMTTKNFMDTRAMSIFETWGKDLQGNPLFFTSSNVR